MTIKGLLKTGGLTALATAMAVTVLPSAASARPGDNDRGSHASRGDNGGGSNNNGGARASRDSGGDRGDRGDRGSRDGGSRGSWNGGGAPTRAAPPAPTRAAPPAPTREVAQRGGDRGSWTGGRGGPANDGGRPAWSGNGNGQPTRGAPPRSGTPARNGGLINDIRDHRNDGRGNDGRGRGNDGRGRGDNNGSWNHNGNHSGQWNNNGNRNNWNNGNYRQWDRRWRDNSRYNWSSWRSHNRSIFHLGSYYSPYRNYSYRRLSIGFALDSLFYSSRYWIDDPYQYRLPDAYGPYRWVRYYDDALLVDIYSGEVVDVMYDFFW